MKEACKTIPSFIGIIFLLLQTTFLNAKTVEVEGEYVHRFPISISIEEGKKEALRRAQIDALEKAFSRNIGETSFITKSNINQKSDSYYSKESYSDLKGEWLETIGEPQFSQPEFDGDIIIIHCYVKGKAKSIETESVDFEFKTLRHIPDKKYESSEFADGDEFFVYFRSPEPGYISIFLLDLKEKEAYCLLPYKESNESAYNVKADKDYYLFSPRHISGEDRSVVDEYVLTANNVIEQNEICIIFSPKKFGKTSLNNPENEATVPRNTSIKKFNEWLTKLKSRDNNICTQKKLIKISPK